MNDIAAHLKTNLGRFEQKCIFSDQKHKPIDIGVEIIDTVKEMQRNQPDFVNKIFKG